MISLLALPALPLLAQSLGDASRFGPPYTVTRFGLGFGARSVAMGGAFMALGEDLEAIGSNPAGLAGLRGVSLMMGARFGGQTVGVPAMSSEDFDWQRRYASSAYGYALSGAAFDHAAAAARVQAGRQSFVFGLAYHRELDLQDPYSFAVTRSDPRVSGYVPPDTYFWGELTGSEDYAYAETISLDVYTASVAFRLLKGLDFGCGVNIRKGRAQSSTTIDGSYNVSDGAGLSMSWTWHGNSEGLYSFSGGTNVDFGLLWRYRWLSLAATYRTGFSLAAGYTLQWDEIEAYSFGETYEDHGTTSHEYTIHQPAQFGFGLAVRPVVGWTVSAECRTGESGYGGENWIVPDVFFEIRAGAEYRLRLRRITLPLRAGGFLAENDDSLGTPSWLSGLCFGAGLELGRFAVDASVLLHSDNWRVDWPSILGPFERSAWDLTVSVSYRPGDTQK